MDAIRHGAVGLGRNEWRHVAHRHGYGPWRHLHRHRHRHGHRHRHHGLCWESNNRSHRFHTDGSAVVRSSGGSDTVSADTAKGRFTAHSHTWSVHTSHDAWPPAGLETAPTSAAHVRLLVRPECAWNENKGAIGGRKPVARFHVRDGDAHWFIAP